MFVLNLMFLRRTSAGYFFAFYWNYDWNIYTTWRCIETGGVGGRVKMAWPTTIDRHLQDLNEL